MNTLADTATNVTEAQIPGALPGETVEIHHNVPGYDAMVRDCVQAVITARQTLLTRAATMVRTPAGDVAFPSTTRSSILHNDSGWVFEVEALEDPDSGERFYRLLDPSVDPIEYAEEFGA